MSETYWKVYFAYPWMSGEEVYTTKSYPYVHDKVVTFVPTNGNDKGCIHRVERAFLTRIVEVRP